MAAITKGYGQQRLSGVMLLSLGLAAMTVAACSSEAQSDAGAEKPVEKVEKSEPVEAKAGTPEQRTVAETLRKLVVARGIVQRVTDMCPDYRIDDAKMNAERERLMGEAKKLFSSQQEFLDAAGATDQEKSSEELRKFFADRNVQWESPEKDYCTLASALHGDQTSAGQYLIKGK